MSAVLGLDLGTSSAKAVVIDTDGGVLGQAVAGNPVTSARAGYAESDPGDWRAELQGTAFAIRDALDALVAGDRPARLVAEPDPAATAFHAERHARFRRVVAALKGPA